MREAIVDTSAEERTFSLWICQRGMGMTEMKTGHFILFCIEIIIMTMPLEIVAWHNITLYSIMAFRHTYNPMSGFFFLITDTSASTRSISI